MRRVKDKNNETTGWMKLDNAAKIYPPVTHGELTGVFRITSVLTTPVKINVLEKSVKETSVLFPSFSVELCRGLFWYYLEYNGLPPRIHLDEGTPCRAFPKSKGEVMYRVLARENRISVEFLHVITDGGGALIFLKILLNIYYRNCSLEKETPLIFPEAPVTETHWREDDKFKIYSKKRFPHPKRLAPAWHLPFKTRTTPGFRAMSFLIPSDKLVEKAKEHHASFTEFLIANYLYSLQELRKKEGRGSMTLRVQVPLDLRKKYNEETTQNFSAFMMPEIDLRLGEYSFDEIVLEVKFALGLMSSEKRLTKIISRNVSKEESPIIRITPLVLKSAVLRIAYNRLGVSQFSGTISNMGRISTSEAGRDKIEAMMVIPPPPHHKIKVTSGVVSFGNNTIITFGSVTENTSLERTYIRFMTEKGLPVKVLQIR